MTNELSIWCNKYDFNDAIKKYISELEKTYKEIAETEKDKVNNQLTMAEWIFYHTNSDDLKGFSNRDKFFYGLGLLSNELSSKNYNFLTDYMFEK